MEQLGTAMTLRRPSTRVCAASIAALAVLVALAANDIARDRWWAVTAAQIADARSSGRPGIELNGRTIAEPVRADDALWLPLRWLAGGLVVGAAVYAATGRRR